MLCWSTYATYMLTLPEPPCSTPDTLIYNCVVQGAMYSTAFTQSIALHPIFPSAMLARKFEVQDILISCCTPLFSSCFPGPARRTLSPAVRRENCLQMSRSN
jgi:hypothetical protein